MPKFCTDEQCVLGHECISSCGKDRDCPCQEEHARQDDIQEDTTSMEEKLHLIIK